MALILHRSNRMERLVAHLARELHPSAAHDNVAGERGSDPFLEVPVVVGSRGMERWLRHQIATLSHHGVASRIAFPFPRQALDGAVCAVVAPPDPALPGQRVPAFWEPPGEADRWSPDVLAFRVIGALRRRLLAAPSSPVHRPFGRARAFLSGAYEPLDRAARMSDIDRPVGVRELTLATEIADCLDRVMRRRPEVAAAWVASPTDQPAVNDRWLATMLADLVAESTGDGAGQRTPLSDRARLEAAVRAGADGPSGVLHVFGLSTLGVDDVRTLTALAGLPQLHVHLYVLAPSEVWIAEDRSAREVSRELGRAERTGHTEPGRIQHLSDELDGARHRNPLLMDLGKPSRDLQALFETLAGDGPGAYLPVDDFVDPASDSSSADTVLCTLQRDLLYATWVDAAGPTPLHQDDRSITFHPCHGPLRQVEVLRELVLHALATDPDLALRDVLVMTPDVATYAPLVEAVFAQKRGAVPAIPVHVADLGLRAVNPVADVLLTLLELVGERVDVPRVMALLALDPLRRRFGLASDDLEDIQRMLVESGARWGATAADRGAVGQPPLHQNTFAFAFERIALGVLMLDEAEDPGDQRQASAAQRPIEGPVAVLRYAALGGAGREADHGFVPWDATTADSQRRFGQVYACVHAVLRHRAQLGAGPATAARWRARIDEALSDLTATADGAAWLTGRVTQELDRVFQPALTAGFAGELDLEAVRSLLSGRFEIPRQGDRQITGALTVCAMEPMRSVPFGVVAMLGMDDGAYPRADHPRAWDPMATAPRPGEHQRRDVDRHLLLEALLSARQRVMILWSGHDVHTGETRPPAVLVSELRDAIDQRFQPHVEAPGTVEVPASAFLTFDGTLQPWSTAAFIVGRRPYRADTPLSFDADLQPAAAALREVYAGGEQGRPAAVRPGAIGEGPAHDAVVDRTISLDTLQRDLRNPQRRLLRQGFRLHLSKDTAELLAREPLALNGLDRWQVRDTALTRLVPGWGADAEEADMSGLATALADRWRAEGRLPIGVVGRQEVHDQVAEAQALLAALTKATAGLSVSSLRPHSVRLSLNVAGDIGAEPWAINGAHGFIATLQETEPVGPPREHSLLISLQAGSDAPKRRLAPWLQLLAASAAPGERTPIGALVVVRKDAKTTAVWWMKAPAAAEATAELARLVQLWRRLARERVPLFPAMSPAIAEAVGTSAASPDVDGWRDLDLSARRTVRRAAMVAWRPYQRAGDEDDPWVTALFPEPDWPVVLPDPPRPGETEAAKLPSADPHGWVAMALGVWAPVLPSESVQRISTRNPLADLVAACVGGAE